MIITSENVYDNNKLIETRKNLQNTLEEYEETYAYDYNRTVKVECIAEFYDKMKSERKINVINRHNIIGELNKIMQKSRGGIKLNKIIAVKITIEGRNNKNLMDIYFKSWCMLIIWRKFYGRDINKRRCLYNKHANRNEKHYCHFNKRYEFAFLYNEWK